MIYWQSFIALTDATVATFGFDFKSLIQRTDIWVGQKDFIKKKQVFTKDIQFAYINSQNFICKLIDPNSWLLTACMIGKSAIGTLFSFNILSLVSRLVLQFSTTHFLRLFYFHSLKLTSTLWVAQNSNFIHHWNRSPPLRV